jgi:hypothetical protein
MYSSVIADIFSFDAFVSAGVRSSFNTLSSSLTL